MSVLAIDIISGALRLISSLTPGEAVEGTEAGNALVVLNQMLAGFSADNGLINSSVFESFPLVVGKTSYQIGTGAPDFNTVRPDEIINQWLYDTVSLIRYPIDSITDIEYNAITLNTIQSIPKVIYYDSGQFPYGVIYIYPVSSLTTYQLNIESIKPIMQFATLSTAMNLPGEYFKALKYLLADELAPEYGFEIPQQLAKKIQDANMMIKAKNFRRTVAVFDNAINGERRGGTILDGFVG